MSYEVKEMVSGDVVEVELTGILTREAYTTFVPEIEAVIQKFGKVRLLVLLNDFHGWDAGALWEDIKFDWHHFRDIERLALVGHTRWEKGMAYFCRPFTCAEIKYFDETELETARAWVDGE